MKQILFTNGQILNKKLLFRQRLIHKIYLNKLDFTLVFIEIKTGGEKKEKQTSIEKEWIDRRIWNAAGWEVCM